MRCTHSNICLQSYIKMCVFSVYEDGICYFCVLFVFGHVCMYTHLCVCLCVYIYIYLYLCIIIIDFGLIS